MVAALNFAAAGSPGGGFLNGARAQEESIARSSGLLAAIEPCQMYAFHRARQDAMYTDWVIYSPDVPVFRTDEGALLGLAAGDVRRGRNDRRYGTSWVTTDC